jgi:hypothetical protein
MEELEVVVQSAAKEKGATRRAEPTKIYIAVDSEASR